MVNGDLLKPNEIVDSLAIYVVSYTIAHKDDKEFLIEMTGGMPSEK